MSNDEQSQVYIVRRSETFDDPATKYRADVYQEVLTRAGATTWLFPPTHQNQPHDVYFRGISRETAKAALEQLPEFERGGAVIDRYTDFPPPIDVF